MKQKKKLTILLTLGAMMFALTGCGMNTEKLVEKTLNALEGKQMTQATGIYEMEIGMEVEGTVMEMDMEMSMDTKACTEPYASYVDMEMAIDVSGVQTTETIQSYTLVEDETLVSYTHTDSTNTWLKQELDMNLEEVMTQTDNYNWLAEKALEDLILAKETQTINDREVYVLSCTLTGEEMQKTLDNMGSMKDIFKESGLEELDFTALSVPTVFYIDKETFLPVKTEMDIEGMGDMMDSMVTSLLGENGLSIEMELDISKLHMVLDNIRYDKIEVPTVPEEGLIIGNQENYNPDQGDGTYVIQESGDAVKITIPEGWNVTDMGYDTISMQRNDQKQQVVYTMHTNVATGLAFSGYIERGDVAELLEQKNYDSHGWSDLDNGYDGMWVKAEDGMNLYYAWTAQGERCYLFVKMLDYTGQYDRNKITTFLGPVEAYELKLE